MSKMTQIQHEEYSKPQLIGMIYPGIKSGNTNLASRNNRYFAYATITSVYVYKIDSLMLVNIIPNEKETVITISLSPHKSDILAISYSSCKTLVIDFIQNSLVSTLESKDELVSIGWYQNETKLLCFTKFFSYFYIYEVTTGKKESTVMGDFANIRVMCVTDTTPQIFIGGNNVGTVSKFIMDEKGSDKGHCDYEHNGHVVVTDIDPNCPLNCLVVWREGCWALFDISTDLKMMNMVEGLAYKFNAASWSQIDPGIFYTGDLTNGIVRVWNASSDKPIDSLTLHTSGVSCLLSLKHSQLLCGFVDGMIAIYNMEQKRFTFKNIAGHSNTIFSMAYLPTTDDTFVSCGAEGSICTWSASAMKQIDRIVPTVQLGHPFSMDVSPGGGMVACGYSSGAIAFFSLQTKAFIFQEKIASVKIVSVSFNQFEPEKILCSSNTGFSVIYDVQKRDVIWKNSIGSTNPRSARYSPHTPGQFALANTQGKLDIFTNDKIDTYSVGGENLANVVWSPHKKNIVATIDDEGYARIWDITNGNNFVVGKHEGKARSIAFHPIFDNILVSSGFDCIIMVHDINKKRVISSCHGHSACIFSLLFSPKNPHLLISASSDSSICFWSLDRIFTKLLITHILKNETDWIRPLIGTDQLIKLAKRSAKASNEKMTFKEHDLIHVNDTTRIHHKIVKRALSNTFHETRLIKRAVKNKERMIDAAKLELFMGDPKKYCELMFATGDFDLAVACSPAVSVNFWGEMMKNRAKLFENANDIANVQLALGDSDEAIQTLIDAGEMNKAFLIAAARRNGSFKYDINQVTKTKKKVEVPYLNMEFNENYLFSEYDTARKRANYYLSKDQLYFAAAAYLTIGDVVNCELLLMKSGQPITAYAIDCLTKANVPSVREKFAQICIQFGNRDVFSVLNEDEKMRMAIAVSYKDINDRSDFYSSIGLKNPNEYANIDSDVPFEKLLNTLLSGNIESSVSMFLNYARKNLTTDFIGVREQSKLISLVDISSLSTIVLSEVACISYYFGIYQCCWKGYRKVYKFMHSRFAELIARYDLGWLKPRQVETKKLTDICYEAKVETRIFPNGYQHLDTLPLGESFDQSTKYGPKYILENGSTVLRMEDALMWFEVTPYSPLDCAVRHIIS